MPACVTCIVVPEPKTELVPPVMVSTLDVVSVRLPLVIAACLPLKVFQSVDER